MPSDDGAWATIDDTWQLADSCIDDEECSLEDAMALLDSLDELRINRGEPNINAAAELGSILGTAQ